MPKVASKSASLKTCLGYVVPSIVKDFGVLIIVELYNHILCTP